MVDRARWPAKVVQAMATLAMNIVLDDDPVRQAGLIAEHVRELLDVDAAAVLLDGAVAGVPDKPPMQRLLDLLPQQGPALDSLRSGRPVRFAHAGRWPAFAAAAAAAGFLSVDAIPLRCNDITEGALALFRSAPGVLPAEQDRVARGLAAHAATLLMLARDLDQQRRLSMQLEGALASRVDIEQAKGVLATRHGTTPDQAFAVLRAYARDHNRSVHELAREIVGGRFDLRIQGR